MTIACCTVCRVPLTTVKAGTFFAYCPEHHPDRCRSCNGVGEMGHGRDREHCGECGGSGLTHCDECGCYVCECEELAKESREAWHDDMRHERDRGTT